MKNLDIVMATYNGATYLSEQLDSIFSSHNFDDIVYQIIISDDNSTDGTLDLVSRYLSKYPCIKIVQNETKSGVVGNFENALKYSKADYVVLSDQDDVWLPEKLSTLYEGITKLEKNTGINKPCLYFTDLEVVDDELNLISSSFFKWLKIDPKTFFSYNSVLLMNMVPGCAMVINKQLKEVALPVKKNKNYIHDWWFLLIAFYGGAVDFSTEATFKYRQHANNAIGVKKRTFYMNFVDLFVDLRKKEEVFDLSKEVFDRLCETKLIDQDSLLFRFQSIKSKSRFTRLLFMFKHKICFTSNVFHSNIIRNIRWIMNILIKQLK